MIGDPQRLQYLEAMGIGTWASRYRFANAKPTEPVEWQAAPTPDRPAPGQRLQALLDAPTRTFEVERDPSVNDAPQEKEAAAPLSRARALLDGAFVGQHSGDGASAADTSVDSAPTNGASSAPASTPGAEPASAVQTAEHDAPATPLADPLRFTLSLSVIGERWWLMLPGERPPSPAGQALLGHMLRSVGVPAHWSPLSSLSWPLMNVPASDPSDEAREGIQVFCAGQARRHGLAIDGAIVIGDEVWAPLLNGQEDDASWACHYLPHPDDLLASAKAKRECWPRLRALASVWQQGVGQPE